MRLRTSSLEVGLPAVWMIFVLAGSADTPSAENTLPNHLTLVLQNVLFASFRVIPFFLHLSRVALRLFLCYQDIVVDANTTWYTPQGFLHLMMEYAQKTVFPCDAILHGSGVMWRLCGFYLFVII